MSQRSQVDLKSAIALALEWCTDNDIRFGQFMNAVHGYALGRNDIWTSDLFYVEDERLARLIVRYIEDH